MVYEDYDYIYIYIYVYKRLNEMSKYEIIKFSNFIFNTISKLLKNISFLVMIGNIISLVRVWLVLSLNFVSCYFFIVDYWPNSVNVMVDFIALQSFQCPLYNHLYFISYSFWPPFYNCDWQKL